MFITDRFVLINFPKTGSTFVREALFKIHKASGLRLAMENKGLVKPRYQELLMAQRYFSPMAQRSNPGKEQHGAVCQIPEEHRSKQIVTCIRDPFERLISLYEFRSWERKPFPDREIIQSHFPEFPNLGFDQFFELMMNIAPKYSDTPGLGSELGPLSRQFVRFYALDPLHATRTISRAIDINREYSSYFPDVKYLHTESLNRELHEFLKMNGYSKRKIEFILSEPKKNTTKKSKSDYFTDFMRHEVIEKEWLFFQLFPEYLPADYN